MAVLYLDNISDELVRRIERLAERSRQSLETTIVHLLEQAVPRGSDDERQHVQVILDRIRQNPIVPTPGTPDSVELLREDRNR